MAQIFRNKSRNDSYAPLAKMIDSKSNHDHGSPTKTRAHAYIHSGAANSRRPPIRRGLSFRRTKLRTVRLGGKKLPRGGFFPVTKISALNLKCRFLLKKIKIYCRSVVEDIFESRIAFEPLQQSMLLENAFTNPGIGLSFKKAAPPTITAAYTMARHPVKLLLACPSYHHFDHM